MFRHNLEAIPERKQQKTTSNKRQSQTGRNVASPCLIPFLTGNSSDNFVSTLTALVMPLYSSEWRLQNSHLRYLISVHSRAWLKRYIITRFMEVNKYWRLSRLWLKRFSASRRTKIYHTRTDWSKVVFLFLVFEISQHFVLIFCHIPAL